MKFRYKVLIANLILLSVGLGFIGYFMIHKNFTLAKEAQLQNSIVQNNILQSTIEYELLQVVNESNENVVGKLPGIGERVAASSRMEGFSFYVYVEEECIYKSENEKVIQTSVPQDLMSDLDLYRKNYMVAQEDGQHYIYVAACSQVQQQNLYIVSKCDISQVYETQESEITFFRFILTAIMIIASLILYFVSSYLTKPLEKLNIISEKMAAGNYGVRVNVTTKDEIGLVAEKFNIMAQSVEKHVAELEDMVHRRDQFVADFTHEIKTPLTTIIGYADTMRSMNLPREDEIQSLTYIFSEGKRLERMSEKLFQLIYLKQHDIEMKVIHVTNLESQILQIITPSMERQNLKVISSFESATILGNPELLVTVFLNLLDNARKASYENQKIEFEGHYTSKDSSFYEISITDHGIGMEPEETQRICDEFYMADKSRSRKEGGAGLGMSLVAMILERHNAQLIIESKPKEGTRMRVLFVSCYQGDKKDGEG